MKKAFTHMLIPKRSIGFLPPPGGMCLYLFTSSLMRMGTFYESYHKEGTQSN